MSFVHLHVHSEYSLLEASTSVKDLAKKAKEMGMPALALTDNGNMFGAIEFYFAAKDCGVKPILGLEVYLAPGSRLERQSADRDNLQLSLRRLVLLAQNFKGYQNLCRLSSIGYQEGFYWKPRIDYEVLQKHSEDLICLSGGLRGEVSATFLKEGAAAAEEKVAKLKELFGDRFYLEIVRTGEAHVEQLNQFLLAAGEKFQVPLVAGNDVHYLTADDQIAQEVLLCIGTNKTLHDESRFRLGANEFYLKSPQEMQSLFADLPQAVAETLKIAERCDLKFHLKDGDGKPIYHLPSYPTQGGVSLKEEIRQLSQEGLRERFQESQQRGDEISEEQKQKYYARLDFELSVIDRMGFNGYFLIVQDFIRWAKAQNIPVGPGRGSGAGSLVAYSLKITDLDPFPSNLLFERFLNPERISMPDFDIDFCQDRRQEVITYVTEKYGQESVSQIITYGKLQTRAALKDVGRVLGMSFSEVDAVSKLIPDKLGISLQESLEMEPRLNELMEVNPQVATLMDLAQRVEGLVRHAGIHAAGVIIADGRLMDHAPLYRGAEGENVVQYDMKHAEKIGLIKFDFLGLKTLTHIARALDLIFLNRGKRIQTQDISLKDKGIYEIMAKGDTLGIFQFEGEGITQAIRQIKPTSFADITAINALYRPGPMAMIPDFAKRKHGEEPIEYPFPILQEILQETYGIIVYQEQVMGIAALIAGYSLGEADMLRRAMGKKIKEEMDRHRERFLSGAKAKNFDLQKANEVFDLMYKFADYGFNKSHAAAYCVVAAQTAWLKNYYPVEFYAALLSTEISNTDNVVRYVKDAQKHGIRVHSPHIQFSEFLFTVKGDEIYFGLGAIKGLGESAANAVVEARKKTKGSFASLEEFFTLVDSKKLNKKSIEALIKAGAFDGFGYHRAELMQGYSKLLERATSRNKDAAIGQTTFFDLAGVDLGAQKVTLEKVAPWSRSQSLSQEKEALGFYLSDHPLKGFDSLASLWAPHKIGDLVRVKPTLPLAEPSKVKSWNRGAARKPRIQCFGLVAQIRDVITKKGTRMAFGQLEDLSGSCEIVVFPDSFAQFEALLKGDKPLLVSGELEVEEEKAKIIVDNVSLFEDQLGKARSLVFQLHRLDPKDYSQLEKLLAGHPGETLVRFEMEMLEFKRRVHMDVASRVKISEELLENIRVQFGRTDFVEVR